MSKTGAHMILSADVLIRDPAHPEKASPFLRKQYFIGFKSRVNGKLFGDFEPVTFDIFQAIDIYGQQLTYVRTAPAFCNS